MGDIFGEDDPAVKDGTFKKWSDQKQKEAELRIRPEIAALVARGNVTQAELNELRCNSWEWEALVPAMTDEVFVGSMWHALENCFTPTTRPFVTYNKAVEGLYAPELLRRYKTIRKKVEDLAESYFEDAKCSVCGARSTPLDGCRGSGGPCILRREIPR